LGLAFIFIKGLNTTKIIIHGFFAILAFYVIISSIDFNNVQVQVRYDDGWILGFIER
jgi:hypothetical protein